MKKARFLYYTLFICCIGLLFSTCKRDPQIVDYKDYPNDVGLIIRGKCATSGCHNDISYEAAGGLNLSTWNDLFKGTRTGATLIPYRADFSPFMYFVNTYNDLGLINIPTMPINKKSAESRGIISMEAHTRGTTR